MRAYLKGDKLVLQMVKEQEQRLRKLDVQRKIEKWRNQIVAHYTITSGFEAFYREHSVSLDEIERLIGELDEILHAFARPLLGQIFMVSDLGQHAREGVDQLVASMKKDAE
jgi:hypothetical protein